VILQIGQQSLVKVSSEYNIKNMNTDTV